MEFNEYIISSTMTVCFVICKLTGIIDWPWLWVLAPIWIHLIFIIILLLILSICITIANLIDLK